MKTSGGTTRALSGSRRGLLHLVERVDWKNAQAYAESRRGGLDRAQEERTSSDRDLRIVQHPNAPDAGRDLLQKLEPFAAHRRLDIGEAGDAAAGPRQARREFLADRIGHGDEHDWDRAGRRQEGLDGSRAPGEERVGLQAYEFLSEHGRAVRVAAGE